MIQTVNPATEKPLAEYAWLAPKDQDRCLEESASAFGLWRRVSVRERCRSVAGLAAELRRRQTELAELMTVEMGKPISESRAEVEKCASTCERYSQSAVNWFEDQILVSSQPQVTVCYQPLGPILAIMPWNFPAWQVIRFAVPTLLAGNVILVKHAPGTLGTAQLLQKIFLAGGFAPGVYQDFPIKVEDVEGVIGDSRVRGVSITGSTRAGRAVAEAAGRNIKRCVLELGGSDPYVVLDDADLDLAAEKIVTARMLNGGQSCIAGKRVIATASVYEPLLSRIEVRLKEYRYGDPRQEQCRLGPLARKDLRETLHSQVEQAVREGAKLKMGGQVPDGQGYFYPATLLTEVNDQNVAFREEFFGPVAIVAKARDESDAIRLANRSSFGLGAALFSRDVQRAQEIAKFEMQAGMVAINGMVRSDPRWPFGGIKDSGLGRELTAFGAHEFVNIKSVINDSL